MDKELDVVYWNEIKPKLKKEYPTLTNADLLMRKGMEDELLQMIAFKLGKTKRQFQQDMEKL